MSSADAGDDAGDRASEPAVPDPAAGQPEPPRDVDDPLGGPPLRLPAEPVYRVPAAYQSLTEREREISDDGAAGRPPGNTGGTGSTGGSGTTGDPSRGPWAVRTGSEPPSLTDRLSRAPVPRAGPPPGTVGPRRPLAEPSAVPDGAPDPASTHRRTPNAQTTQPQTSLPPITDPRRTPPPTTHPETTDHQMSAHPTTPPPEPAQPPVVRPPAARPADAPAPSGHRAPGRRVRVAPSPSTRPSSEPTLPRGGDRSAPFASGPGRADDLGSDALLRGRRHVAPLTGWRRAVRALTFGAVEPGPSAEQQRHLERVDAVRAPIVGTHRIAVISLKGGVGKTTTTMMLGSTLASLRGDRVVALDANPDAGTLGDRLRRRTPATVRDLLTHYTDIRSAADLAAYTSQAPSRLEVIANDVDPSVSTAVTAADYLRIVEMLGRYYSVVLTDSGTGLLHDAMSGILNAADTLVLISSASVDGARSASTTLDWLQAQGWGHLVSSAVTVVSSVRPGGREVDVDAIAEHFANRCRAVVRIPFDPHLETGAETDLDALAPGTREAYLELAVAVAADFDRGDETARSRLRGRPRIA